MDNLGLDRWLGQKVSISGTKYGTLRYFGKAEFAEGSWCGVELDEPIGKNDGSVNNVRYFTCKDQHGIFAPESKVLKLIKKSSFPSYIQNQLQNDSFVKFIQSPLKFGTKSCGTQKTLHPSIEATIKLISLKSHSDLSSNCKKDTCSMNMDSTHESKTIPFFPFEVDKEEIGHVHDSLNQTVLESENAMLINESCGYNELKSGNIFSFNLPNFCKTQENTQNSNNVLDDTYVLENSALVNFDCDEEWVDDHQKRCLFEDTNDSLGILPVDFYSSISVGCDHVSYIDHNTKFKDTTHLKKIIEASANDDFVTSGNGALAMNSNKLIETSSSKNNEFMKSNCNRHKLFFAESFSKTDKNTTTFIQNLDIGIHQLSMSQEHNLTESNSSIELERKILDSGILLNSSTPKENAEIYPLVDLNYTPVQPIHSTESLLSDIIDVETPLFGCNNKNTTFDVFKLKTAYQSTPKLSAIVSKPTSKANPINSGNRIVNYVGYCRPHLSNFSEQLKLANEESNVSENSTMENVNKLYGTSGEIILPKLIESEALGKSKIMESCLNTSYFKQNDTLLTYDRLEEHFSKECKEPMITDLETAESLQMKHAVLNNNFNVTALNTTVKFKMKSKCSLAEVNLIAFKEQPIGMPQMSPESDMTKVHEATFVNSNVCDKILVHIDTTFQLPHKKFKDLQHCDDIDIQQLDTASVLGVNKDKNSEEFNVCPILNEKNKTFKNLNYMKETENVLVDNFSSSSITDIREPLCDKGIALPDINFSLLKSQEHLFGSETQVWEANEFATEKNYDENLMQVSAEDSKLCQTLVCKTLGSRIKHICNDRKSYKSNKGISNLNSTVCLSERKDRFESKNDSNCDAVPKIILLDSKVQFIFSDVGKQNDLPKSEEFSNSAIDENTVGKTKFSTSNNYNKQLLGKRDFEKQHKLNSTMSLSKDIRSALVCEEIFTDMSHIKSLKNPKKNSPGPLNELLGSHNVKKKNLKDILKKPFINERTILQRKQNLNSSKLRYSTVHSIKMKPGTQILNTTICLSNRSNDLDLSNSVKCKLPRKSLNNGHLSGSSMHSLSRENIKIHSSKITPLLNQISSKPDSLKEVTHGDGVVSNATVVTCAKPIVNAKTNTTCNETAKVTLNAISKKRSILNKCKISRDFDGDTLASKTTGKKIQNCIPQLRKHPEINERNIITEDNGSLSYFTSKSEKHSVASIAPTSHHSKQKLTTREVLSEAVNVAGEKQFSKLISRCKISTHVSSSSGQNQENINPGNLAKSELCYTKKIGAAANALIKTPDAQKVNPLMFLPYKVCDFQQKTKTCEKGIRGETHKQRSLQTSAFSSKLNENLSGKSSRVAIADAAKDIKRKCAIVSKLRIPSKFDE